MLPLRKANTMSATIGDVIRVTAKMSWNQQDIQNVYHIQMQATTSESNMSIMTDIADDLEDAYGYLYAAMHDEMTFDSISFYNLTADEFMAEIEWPTLTTGTESTDPLPMQCAALVRFGTDVLGSQGRKFIGVLTEANLDPDGTISAGLATAMGNFAAQLLNGITGVDWSATYVNWNETLSRVATWASAFVNLYFCTQRRRRPGVGS